jgi:hypothetical protein
MLLYTSVNVARFAERATGDEIVHEQRARRRIARRALDFGA